MPQKILIIEDTLTYQQALKRALTQRGYEVVCVSSGEAGLEILRTQIPDLVILDLILPGIDGREVCRRLKMNITLRLVPVMMLTMKDDDRFVAEGLEAGADTCVNKNESLDQIVHRAIALIHSKDQIQTTIDKDPSTNLQQDILKGKQVLIVDDDITYLQACKRFLNEKGYIIKTAKSGQDCLSVVSQELPDLLLLDLRMPEMDGVETCHRLRLMPGMESLPIVMLTASDSQEDVIRGFQAGISDYVVKSGEFALVELRVHALIRRKYFEEETRKVQMRLLEAQTETQIARAEQAAAEIRSEAEKKISGMKDQFLANMSHELRTPLNSIIGFAEVLYEESFGKINEKQKDYLSDILSSGKHLLSLINDILDLSKISAGKMELQLSTFFLDDLLKESLVMIKETAFKNHIKLETEIEPDIGSVIADERKIKQILINLLSNAIKFTPDGGEIGVRVQKQNSEIIISVCDTGIGLEKEDQEKIFQEFFQLQNTYTKTQKGTGLGLSLTKKLVELHNGKISVESAGKDLGSTFIFTIPSKQEKET